MFTRTRSSTSPDARRPSARPLGVAALCVALVWATPAVANAQAVAHPDAVGDMARDSNTGLAPAPKRTGNDASNTAIFHGARRVTIRVDYVDLAKTAGERQFLWMRLKTNEGVRGWVFLGAGPRHWAGDAVMIVGRRELTKVVSHSIDYEANVVRVSFPRRVAGFPDWVKFKIVTGAETRNAFYVDDALQDGGLPMGFEDLAWSGRIHRGPAA